MSLGAQIMHDQRNDRIWLEGIVRISFSDKFGSLGAHIMLAWETYLDLSCWVENENDWNTYIYMA